MDAGRIISLLVAIGGIAVGAIQAAKPEALGIDPVASAWLGVASAVIAGLQMLLPKVQGTSTTRIEVSQAAPPPAKPRPVSSKRTGP